MLACDGDAYVLYLESSASDAAVDSATDSLERMLRENHHYDLCRRLEQLRQLRVARVSGASSTYLQVRAESQILGNIKIPALDREQGWSGRFEVRSR